MGCSLGQELKWLPGEGMYTCWTCGWVDAVTHVTPTEITCPALEPLAVQAVVAQMYDTKWQASGREKLPWAELGTALLPPWSKALGRKGHRCYHNVLSGQSPCSGFWESWKAQRRGDAWVGILGSGTGLLTSLWVSAALSVDSPPTV